MPEVRSKQNYTRNFIYDRSFQNFLGFQNLSVGVGGGVAIETPLKVLYTGCYGLVKGGSKGGWMKILTFNKPFVKFLGTTLFQNSSW